MKLVTGGSGQLGNAFRTLWPDAAFPTSAEFDLRKLDRLADQLDEWRPSVIVNCAGYTDVDGAEKNESTALAVNGVAVGHLARYASAHQIPFVTFSTDYVFDGKATSPYLESHQTSPINAYGRSKLDGERRALAFPGSLVVRTSWVVSGTHPNFVATMLRLIPEREIRVVGDQRGCPTIADDLAAATLRCLDANMKGLVHLANPPPTTWFDLAQRVASLAGMDSSRVVPCTTADYPLPASRPAYSVLGSERLGRLGVEPLPSWESSLPAVVAQLSGGARS